MTVLFDTSALVAAHNANHPQFSWASAQLGHHPQPSLCAHSFAECYSVLTASPQLRYHPDDVTRFLESLSQTWTVIPLDAADYLRAAHRCRDLGLQGGAIYDTLVAEAALKVGAKGLVTLNPKHFRRLGPAVEPLVISP